MKKFTSLTFFSMFLLELSAYAVTTSWTGTVSKDWRRAGNWTAGVPTATVDVIIGDANFTGPNQPDLSANSFCKSLTIGIGSKVATLKVDKTLTVSGDVTIGTNGTITHTAGTMSLAGNWMKVGAYTASGNNTTVAFSGATQSLNGITIFRKLTVNASSTTVLNANVTVVNQLTVAGRLDPNEAPTRVVSGAGKLVVNSGGRLQVKASTFAGNYGLTGAKTLNAGSTVDYAATLVNQTVNNTLPAYGTLRISGALTKTLPGNLPALASSLATAGNILVEGGVLDLAGFTANRGTTVVGGTLSVANGATLKIGGTNSVPTNYRTHTLGVSSTVEYSGTNQSVAVESYGNLALSTSSGAVTKTLPAAVLIIAGNLTSTAAVGSSVSFTALAPITIRGSLLLGQGTTFNGGAFVHSVGSNWTSNGTFNGGSGQITLAGSDSVVSGAGTNLFNDLVITGAGVTAAPGTDLSVAGNFSTTGIGSFTHNLGGAGRLTMSGSGKSISGNGITLNHLVVTGSISTASSISIGGDLTVNGSLIANAGTITFSGPANTLGGTGPVTFNRLNISGAITTGRNFAVTSDLSVSGSFSATAGTATFAGTSLLSGTANLFNVVLSGSRLQLGAGSGLGLRGALTLSSGVFDATTSLPNTVNYNATGPQTVVATSYGNLVFSGGGAKTASGALVVFGSLTIGAGTTFAAGSFLHSLYGDWINQGPDPTPKAAIQLIGDKDASLSGPTIFGTLIVTKSGPGRVVSLADNVTVDTLNITNTTMLTGTNAVTIASDRTGNGIILGTITRTHPFITGVAYAFESPFNTISFTSGSGITNVTVSVVLGPVRDFPFGGCINRQYTVTLASASPYTATLRLHYLDSGLNGNTEAGIQLWRFTGGSAVSGKTANDPSDNWVEQSSLTNLTGRWTLSDDLNVVRWTGQVSSAWENPTNWITAQGSPQLPPSTNDIVELAAAPFSNQPFISTPVSIRILSFGSAQTVNLTLDTGSSLVLAGNSGNITATWTNDVTHTIEVGDQLMSVGGVFPLSDGTNGHDIYLDIGSGTVSVADQFTLSGSSQVTFTGSGRLELGGDFIHTDGTFTPGTGTVDYNGAGAQVVAGDISYHDLTLSKTGGTATLFAPAIVEANLTLTNAGTFLVKAPLTVTHHVVIGAGTTLNGDSSTLEVGANWTRVGTFDPDTGTVIFNGLGLQSIAATTFNHLTVNKPSGTAILAGTLTIEGDLNVAAGVLDLSTNTANRSSFGGTFTLAAGSTLKIGSGSSFPASFATRSLANTSTAEYSGTGPQIVTENAYGNLAFSNGGSNPKALAGDTSTAGDLVINSGATLFGGTFALNVQGNWINAGAFVPSVGLVTLSGAGKTLSGPTVFNQLTVSGSYTTTSNIAVNAAARISGSLSTGNTTNTFAGDFSNTSAFNSAGTVVFTGVGPQLIELGSGFASSGTVNFNGTVAPELIGSQPLVFQHVNVNNTGGIAPAAEWTVNGNFSVGPGATFAGGLETQTFKGSFNNTGTVTSSGTLAFLPSAAATLNLNGAAFASTGTVIFGGTNQITFGSGALAFRSVTIANSHAAGVTPVANWTVNENLQIEAGAALHSGNGLTLTLFGDWSNEGVFDGGNSIVVMNGIAEIAGAGSTTFHHLTILGTVAAVGDFNVSGNFTNNAAFDGTGSTVTFVGSSPAILGGSTSPTLFDSLHVEKTAAPVNLAISLNGLTDLTISGGSLDLSTFSVSQDVAGGTNTLTMGPGALLRIGGTSTLPAFVVNDLDAASTVEYYGTGTQPIAAVNYGNLTSSSTGSRVLTSGIPIGIAGVFAPGANAYTITGSTIDFNGDGSQIIPSFNYNNLVSSLTGARVLASSGTIRVAGTFTPGANTYTVTNSTINFNGGAQTVPVFNYFNLATSGSGTKTLAGDLLVSGSLSLSAALADGGFTATVLGNADNDATHTGTGKILLAAGAQQHALSGSGSYNNLELNDPSGATLTETNLTVTGTLTFTSGNITTTTNKVIISPPGSVARASGHVVGHLQKNVPTGPKVTNTFEIGDVSSFAPVTLVLTNVTVTGNVIASTTPGAHPDITNSVVSATRGVNRYWTMTSSGTLFSSYDTLFNFVTSDVDFVANPANFIVGKRDGGVWTLPAVSNLTATNIMATGMTNFSEYVVGEHIPSAAPAIATQPQSQNVNLGGTATFSVEATGAGTLTYQWLFNGNPIVGATNSTLVITNMQSSDAGTYSVIIDNGSLSISAPAVLTLNQPPTLTAITDRNIDEGSLLTVATSASDPEGGLLTYNLLVPPPGASISTNGVITWTPTEAQGPSTNTLTVRVTDDGVPTGLTDTKSFTVTVNDVNNPPVLTLPGTQTIAEQTALNVNATATDSDPPPDTLFFALVSGPTGLTVSSAGAIAWTPSETQGPSTNTVTVRVFDNGSPSLSTTNSFQVIVTEVNTPPVLTVPAAQTIPEQTALNVNATATDSDLPANTLTFALVSGPTGLTVSSAGAIAWTPSEAQGSSTNTVTVRVFDNGPPSLSTTNSFQVIVIEVNTPPLLTVPGTQTIAEQTALSVNATAIDSDAPTNTLTFALVSGPTGLTVSSAGAIAWTPSEAQGPSTNTVTVRVFDNGSPSLSTTNSFQVIVTEVNTPPVLTVPAAQTIPEQTALNVNATATDSDLPANTLTFALVSGPTGLTVSSAGAIAWTPSEAQGSSTNTVTVRVFDNGPPSLSTTNSFQVIVIEVNTPPLLTVPGTQTIAEQTALSVNATAIDSDAPTNTLTFALVSGPTGLTVSSAGAITWTPSEAQGPSTNTVTVRAFDNGSPSLSATNSFQVIVTELNTLPVLTVPATPTIAELTALSVAATATDSDSPANTLTFALVSGPTGLTVSSAGAITWTPSEAQGPSTNTVIVRAFDNGTPSLSATNSFQVIVTEVNNPPVLTLPVTQTIAEQTALSVNATATDSDSPANSLTFALVSGPTSLTVSSAGAITWTPSEAQGPSTNTVTVRVFDNGSPSLSATNSFQVIVTEVNNPPVLTLPATQTIAEQTALSVNATATDPDAPANTLSFALVSGPTGLTVASGGAIAWTPSETQGPSTNTVTVRVFDNGSPTLSRTNSFQVIVTESNTPPALTVPGTQSITEQTALSVNATATDSDLPANTLSFALVSGPTGLTVASGGAIAWTPSEAQGLSTNTVTVRVFDNGSPTLSDTNSFQVIVTESNTPPALTVPGTQSITEQTALSVNATATDSDLPANTLSFALVSGPTGLTVASGGAIAWTPSEAQGPSTNTVTVRVFDNGSPTLSRTNSFQVIVTESNTPPALTVPGTQSVAEQTALSVNATATDSDLPANTLSFALVSGPTGLTVASGGAIAWTPSEAQGPSTNTVTVRVFDNGSPTLSRTNSFQVIVTESNTPPALTVPGTQSVTEQTALSVNATATDSDLPANTLSFALVSGPTGLTIASGGAIAWTPSEAQGPSTNTVTVRVFDNGSPTLSRTNSFQVIVTESNTPPALTVPGTQSITEQTALSVNATATDSDLPANTLSFALVSGPTGLTVSSGGAIAWTPSEAQGPSTNTVTVRVFDNGSPTLSRTNSFQVIVTESNTPPALTVPGTQSVTEQTALSVNATATDSDLPANALSFALVSGPTGLTVSLGGAIAWTPSAAQGPSTNTVTVRVFDNGSPSLSDTNSFQVIVTETNAPPTAQSVQIINGNVEVSFGGIPGQTYAIEATQNLNPFIIWTPVATNLVADANGLFKYVDTQARSLPMRFFRARTP